MIAETSGDAVVYKYVRGAGLLYAENAADEKTWYVKDAHGDTVQLTDGNGNIVWNYAYDAFGNQKETVNSSTEPYNPFRYTGEYFDAETGFIYLRARYMDPQTGRFVSEDPVGDGANWYVYAAGNPVMLFDPSGYQREAGYYTINGVYDWYEDPDASEFGKESNTYKTINDASERWFAASTDEEREKQHAIAENARNLARSGVDTVYLTTQDYNAGVTTFTIMSEKKQYKDVTVPINNALAKITPEAENKLPVDYIWFISQVNHNKPWDIKRSESWESTIGSTYPGSAGAEVVYNGYIVTPEYLGNYTYGYIGAAMGISSRMLHTGSFVAALPIKTWDSFMNEFSDWNAIDAGYCAYHGINSIPIQITIMIM